MLEKSAIQQDSLQNHSERNDTQGKKLYFRSRSHSSRVLGDCCSRTGRMSSLPYGQGEFLKYIYWSTFTKSPKITYCGALAPDSIPSIRHHISPNVFAFRARRKVHLFIQVYASGMNAKPWLLVCLHKEGRVWIYKLPMNSHCAGCSLHVYFYMQLRKPLHTRNPQYALSVSTGAFSAESCLITQRHFTSWFAAGNLPA